MQKHILTCSMTTFKMCSDKCNGEAETKKQKRAAVIGGHWKNRQRLGVACQSTQTEQGQNCEVTVNEPPSMGTEGREGKVVL